MGDGIACEPLLSTEDALQRVIRGEGHNPALPGPAHESGAPPGRWHSPGTNEAIKTKAAKESVDQVHRVTDSWFFDLATGAVTASILPNTQLQSK